MNQFVISMVTTVMLIGGVMPVIAHSSEAPQVLLKVNTGLLAGNLKDGSRIGQGTFISQNIHKGFQLWSQQSVGEVSQARYLLTGKQNPTNIIRVRLETNQGDAGVELPGVKGLFFPVQEEKLTFDIVADGNQLIKADRYAFNIDVANVQP